MHFTVLIKGHIIQHKFHDDIFVGDSVSSLIYFLELPKLKLIDIVHPHPINSLNHVKYLLNLFSILGGEYFAIFYHVD